MNKICAFTHEEKGTTVAPVGYPTRYPIVPRGFTLIEALIVLIIIASFFIISIPLFSRFAEGAKLDMTARNIASVLRTARSYAITESKICCVKFDNAATPNRHHIYYESEGPETVIDKIYYLPNGIWFYNKDSSDPIDDAVTFTGDAACFNSTGQLNELNDSSVYLADGQSKQARGVAITVERITGGVHID